MTKRHNEVFDAVLSGVPMDREKPEEAKRSGARFLKRSNAISERVSGDNEEKTLLWVDPNNCQMWERHNRDYSLLSEETCRDLIEGIRAQGRQEFPAIVRRISGVEHEYEVICGARRHFAVSWLRANNYPQFKYLIEVRDLSDEEAFRLADIENRDREDISDYERAVDYAAAIKNYYGGKQKAMAERLEVSEVWLSRYLELSRLPDEVVKAFISIREIKELHARTLKPLLKAPKSRKKILTVAKELAGQQRNAHNGQGPFVNTASVLAALKNSGDKPPKKRTIVREIQTASGTAKMSVQQTGSRNRLEFSSTTTQDDLRELFEAFLTEKSKVSNW